jgi:hypothetical protein
VEEEDQILFLEERIFISFILLGFEDLPLPHLSVEFALSDPVLLFLSKVTEGPSW